MHPSTGPHPLLVTLESVQSLKVAELKQRNEVGPARTLLIIALTYGCLFCYMWLVNMEAALLSAVVPTVGYALSTLAFPGARDRWGGI